MYNLLVASASRSDGEGTYNVTMVLTAYLYRIAHTPSIVNLQKKIILSFNSLMGNKAHGSTIMIWPIFMKLLMAKVEVPNQIFG